MHEVRSGGGIRRARPLDWIGPPTRVADQFPNAGAVGGDNGFEQLVVKLPVAFYLFVSTETSWKSVNPRAGAPA
jgi:hypothetical protein